MSCLKTGVTSAFLRSSGTAPLRTIYLAYISHDNGLHIFCNSLGDFGVIFWNLPSFELSKLFISILIPFGITSEKLHSVGSLKYYFVLNILRWPTYLFKAMSIGSESSLTWNTWGPMASKFFTVVSKKLLNSFDKLLSSDITLS